VKEIARPAASASGPNLCKVAAVPSTIGTIGSTQGESTERIPARNASPRVPSGIASLYSPLSTNAAMEAGLVSPTVRAFSVPPL
jgi:hypothetical protein